MSERHDDHPDAGADKHPFNSQSRTLLTLPVADEIGSIQREGYRYDQQPLELEPEQGTDAQDKPDLFVPITGGQARYGEPVCERIIVALFASNSSLYSTTKHNDMGT